MPLVLAADLRLFAFSPTAKFRRTKWHRGLLVQPQPFRASMAGKCLEVVKNSERAAARVLALQRQGLIYSRLVLGRI